MAFHIGQRVVCVNARFSDRVPCERYPKRHAVYTVRAMVPRRAHGYDEDGLYLVEIVNARGRYRCPDGRRRRCEVAFRMSRFRPVRTTNIEVFTRMLEPVPTAPHELMDS